MTRSYIVDITDDVDKAAFQKFEEQYGAEEVIRCKDCKYSEYWYWDHYLCSLWSEEEEGGARSSVWDTGFCNYGKAREQDARPERVNRYPGMLS